MAGIVRRTVFTFDGDKRLLETPLEKVVGALPYREKSSCERFLFNASQLIAAGYETVQDFLEGDAVYVLRPRDQKK